MTDIKQTLLALKKNANATQLEVQIQKPLASGIRIMAHAVTDAGKKSVKITDARVFFAFTKEYACDKPWNQMFLILNDQDVLSVEAEFDSVLQKETEKRIK